MGNYASTSELIARFEDNNSVLHAVDNTSGTVSDSTTLERLEDGISGGEGEINAYLGTRYKVPVDTSTDTNMANMLRAKTLDLAMYYIFAVRSKHVTDSMQQAYDNVMAWLRDVSDGKAVLPTATAVTATTANSIIPQWGDNDAVVGTSGSSERKFTRTSQGKF